MNLTKLTIKRPVSAMLIVLALAVFGITSILGFKLELQPDMDMPMLLVITTYPGADRSSVEELVTKEVESAGAALTGVKTYTSRVSDNYSFTMFSYDYDMDIDEAYSDLRIALDTASMGMPDDAGDPVIMELSMDAMDTLIISATAKSDIDLLSYVEEEVVPEFETLLGVADINVSGGKENYIKVQLQEDKLAQYGLNMATVAQYLAAIDFSIPAGSVEQGNQNISVSSSAEATSISELQKVPILTAAGSLIALEDIADITMSQKSASSISRYEGHDNIQIGIQKKQSHGTVNVASDVKKVIKKLQDKNDAVDFMVIYDASEMIITSLSSVGKTLLLGILFSMLVLFLFFGDLRASLIVGSSMPISLFVSLIMMNAMGFSLNIVTIGALVIAIGMMVDSSIVVIESCFRLKDQHADFKVAAIEGARIVAASITASTITTIVVYFPLSVMKGLSGQLFSQLGFTIIFSMLASLVSALSLVPLFFAKFKPREKKELKINDVLEKVGHGYDRLLRKILHRKVLAVIVAFSLLVLSFVMLKFTNMELMPTVDESTVAIKAEFRAGTKLDYIDDAITEIEQMVAGDEKVESYSVTISDNVATITGYLKKDIPFSTSDVVELWTQELSDVTNMDIDVSASGTNITSMMAMDTEVDLSGTNLDDLKVAARQVEDIMATTEGVLKVSNDLSTAQTVAEIKIDPMKAMSVGFSPAQIAMNINNAISGLKACTIKRAGEEYSVMLEYPSGSYDNLNDLMTLQFTTPYNTNIVLADVAEIAYTDSPQSLTRVDGVYQVVVTAATIKELRFIAADAINAAVDELELPNGVYRSESTMQEMMNEEFSAIIRAIIIAAFLVFLVMAMQFESPKFSGIVMMSIPFSLIGSFGLLFLTRSTLSMVSLMGVLMLIGIVVNNGILYVDTTNMLRKEMPIQDALIKSGQIRLRPILMTTLTTILSMMPMALGIGEGGVMMQGMALVIVGGLIASTILILILLPSFYLIIYDNSKKRRKKVKLKKEQRENNIDKIDVTLTDTETKENPKDTTSDKK